MWKSKIILVPFPFDNFSGSKARPALCLCEPVGKHNHILIAFISSQIPDDVLKSDLLIRKDSPEFQRSGLKVPSVIRLHHIASLGERFILRELGSLSQKGMRTVSEKLIDLLSLHRVTDAMHRSQEI